MATVRFSVPNWGQTVIAKAARLDPDGVVVRAEDESRIVFLENKSRKEYIVNKITGTVIEC